MTSIRPGPAALFCIVLLSAAIGCRKDDSLIQPVVPDKVGIRIEEELVKEYNSTFNLSLNFDTVMTNRYVYFSSYRKYESYQWEILEDPGFLRTASSFELLFINPAKITLQLVGKLPDHGHGFVYDTLIKVVSVIPENKNPLIGIYAGTEFPGNGQSNLSVACDTISLPDQFFGFRLANFPPGCNYTYILNTNDYRIGYRVLKLTNFIKNNDGIYIITGSTCDAPTGWAILSDDNSTLTFQYKTLTQVSKDTFQEKEKKFKGKKL